jgi:hypothetical protein
VQKDISINISVTVEVKKIGKPPFGQWIKFVQVKRKDFIKPTANSVLCEKHFPPGSYPVEYELKKAMNLPVKLFNEFLFNTAFC